MINVVCDPSTPKQMFNHCIVSARIFATKIFCHLQTSRERVYITFRFLLLKFKLFKPRISNGRQYTHTISNIIRLFMWIICLSPNKV